MPKINQEEYEILKELDNKWKWIARDEDRCLYVLTEKPVRKDGPSSYWGWIVEPKGPYAALELFDERHLFQFVQWEDDEPFNIAELIEEYESEETEVKNIEELKSWFEEDKYYEGEYVKHKIDQLDEPEVLSSDWIDEHAVRKIDGKENPLIVYVDDLQNLLVPKQKKVEVPRFVADFIESYDGDFYGLLYDADNISSDASLVTEEYYELGNWLSVNSDELLQAVANGYEVEEEQKYYVMNNDNRMLLVRMMDGKTITEADPFKLEDMYEGEKKSHRLTEQEIKDYDPRYWAFRKPVEELEE